MPYHEFYDPMNKRQIVVDQTRKFAVVLEPEEGLIGIGSGGSFALSAAKALINIDAMDAEQIARKALGIAAEICIYTNNNVVLESLDI